MNQVDNLLNIRVSTSSLEVGHLGQDQPDDFNILQLGKDNTK